MRISYDTPYNWEFCKLESLALPIKGSIRIGPFGSALKKHEYSVSGVGVLGIEHVHPNEFRWETPKYIPEEKYRELTQYTVEPGDVLVTNMGTVGRACYVPEGIEKSIISSHLIKVTLDKTRCLHKYLCYALNNSELVKAQIEAKCHGAIMAGFNSSLLKELHIPLPPIDQQKKITAILDAADVYRQKTKVLIKKYDELTQSLFLDMFGDPVTNPKGWEKIDLNKLCSFKKINVKPEEILDGETYIGLECIEKKSGEIIKKFIVETGEVKSNKFWFNHEYILYGKLRPYLNKVANADFEGVCSTDIIPIKPLVDKSSKEFIISMMRGSWFVAFADERSSGANLPRISPKEVEKYQTINPPIKLQNNFGERVKDIEAQKAQAQASLAQAEDLFNSLLQRAFKGELVK